MSEVTIESAAADILYWEQKLATAEFRRSVSNLADVFDDSFVEFGASGRRFTKAQILELLKHEQDFEDYVVEDFEVKSLSGSSYLVTYRIPPRQDGNDTLTGGSLRSSIWQKTFQGKWVLIFHQGTRLPAEK